MIVGLPFKDGSGSGYYEVLSISEQDQQARALSWALGLTVPFAGLLAALVAKMGDKYPDRRRKGPQNDENIQH